MRDPRAPQSIVELVLFASASALLVPLVCSRAPISTTSRPPRLRTTMCPPSTGNAAQLPSLSLLSILHSHPDYNPQLRPSPRARTSGHGYTLLFPFPASAPVYIFSSSSNRKAWVLVLHGVRFAAVTWGSGRMGSGDESIDRLYYYAHPLFSPMLLRDEMWYTIQFQEPTDRSPVIVLSRRTAGRAFWTRAG
ncbi:hypothetical protein B0H10DRAFT_2234770 [Mycena sp. CBHHK59/15]|nr:hypothetical protein B0H10DRAFT_2234770 [Mycena sp. CBHHK59/15]